MKASDYDKVRILMEYRAQLRRSIPDKMLPDYDIRIYIGYYKGVSPTELETPERYIREFVEKERERVEAELKKLGVEL